ncbi:MAG: ABC transporter ATP-binding protein [Oscillospiraceae bacterium]|nr:ABC transporter ATP-binding protein [Oscillospiraceae bacterium]
MLEIKNISCGYKTAAEKRTVLSGVSMTLSPGQNISLLGANGAGKTTLFKAILGMLPVTGGTITLDGADIKDMTRASLARRIAYVPQQHTPPFPYTVTQVLLMGRCSHLGAFSSPGEEDYAVAHGVLTQLGIEALAERNYAELSGGERQLVLIGRALTQQSDYLLLDEPTSNLDYGNQIRILKKMRELSAHGIGIMTIMHNPEHALLIGGECIVLGDGRVIASGRTSEIITPELINTVYGVTAELFRLDGRTFIRAEM